MSHLQDMFGRVSLVFVLMGCATAKVAPSAAEDDLIREAVFRHMFEANASGQQKSAGVYCLEVDGQDPPPALLARFAQHRPPVRPASACVIDQREGVRDARGGTRGLLLKITAVRRIAADRAEVEGGYWEAGLSASGNLYQLVRDDGRWKVVEDRMLWISLTRPKSPTRA